MKYHEYNKIRSEIISNNRSRRMKGKSPFIPVPVKLPIKIVYQVFDDEDTYIGTVDSLLKVKAIDGAYSYQKAPDLYESEAEVSQEYIDKLNTILSQV